MIFLLLKVLDEFTFHLKRYRSEWTRATHPLRFPALLNLESGRWEMYSVYLVHFLNSIRFGWTKVLNQIKKQTNKQTILTYLELISNSACTFTTLLPNSSKHFFESFNGHLHKQKIIKEKILKQKCEKLACTHEANNFAINCSWVYMIGHWWLYGRKWPRLPLPKNKLGPSNVEGPQEIWNIPSP